MTTPPPPAAAADDWAHRLRRAWALMAVLTVVSVAGALAGFRAEAGPWAAALPLAIAFVKARQVLDHFLDLRRAGGNWRTVFTVLLLTVLAGIYAAWLVPLLLSSGGD